MSEIVVLTFPERELVLDAVDHLKKIDHIVIKHSAVIAKAVDGEALVLENDINPNEGAIAGGTLGALLGGIGIAGLGAFLLPGVGALIAIGAGAFIGGVVGGATGSVAARLFDMGFDNAQIHDLAQRLNAGGAALVIEFDGDEIAIARLHEELKPYQADFLHSVKS